MTTFWRVCFPECCFRCGKQQWCIISHDYRGPLESDIGYTIEVKYFAFRVVWHSCVFHNFSMWLKGVGYKENRMQLGPPPAYSTRIYDGMSGIRVQVAQVCWSRLALAWYCVKYPHFLYSFSVFLQDGHILVIDPVTAILNLMTAFGLLAVASLVRNLSSAQALSLLLPFRSCLFSWRAFVPCCKLPYGSVESSESSWILLNHISKSPSLASMPTVSPCSRNTSF